MEQESELNVLGPTSNRGHWSASARHRAGAFYTPPYLAQFVVSQTLIPALKTIKHKAQVAYESGDLGAFRLVVDEAQVLRVCDPACGCGRFLLPAFRALRDLHVWLARRELRLKLTVTEAEALPCASTPVTATLQRCGSAAAVSATGREHSDLSPDHDAWTQGTHRALLCIQGIDLNPEAVAAAQAALLCAAGVSGDNAAAAGLIPGLAVGDSLTPKKDTPQWDIVIGNPPWGAAAATAAIARQMGLPATNANTFGLFLVACLDKLTPGGRLGFVLPRNFCKGNDYAHLRAHLLQVAALEWLGDAGRAFPGVTQEVVVVIARRLHKDESAATTRVAQIQATHTEKVSNVRLIPQSAFAQMPGCVLTLSANLRQMDICSHMEEMARKNPQGATLRHWVTWARGLEYGKNGALIRCPKCGWHTSIPKKKQASKACANCGATLSATVPDYALITPTYDQAHTVPIYSGRHVRRYVLTPPYWADPAVQGVAYKDPAIFAGPKILAPKIAPFVAAALDLTDAWATQGVYMLRPVHALWDVFALLALLNSAPMSFYYQYRYNDMASLTTNVTLANLLRLPVPPISPDTLGDKLLTTLREGAQCLAQNMASGAGSIEQVELMVDNAVGDLFYLSQDNMEYIGVWKLEQAGGGINTSPNR